MHPTLGRRLVGHTRDRGVKHMGLAGYFLETSYNPVRMSLLPTPQTGVVQLACCLVRPSVGVAQSCRTRVIWA